MRQAIAVARQRQTRVQENWYALLRVIYFETKDYDRLLEVLSRVADHTKLEMQQFEHDLEAGPPWNAGEVTGPGTLVCDSCVESLRFHATGYIPSCPGCGHTVYHRKTVSEELGRDD